MFRFNKDSRSAVALAIVALITACTGDSNNKVLGPQVTGANSIFQSYVSLGNSITAGYQSGGILDSTQRRSYAVLLAAQMGTRFAYPSLAGRGCAPPIVNFTTQARFGTTPTAPATSSTCDLRNPATTDILNNVAVPGATVADLTAASGTSASNILTSLFLGGKTQVQKALDAKPTFATVWIGNNDVLAAALSGVLVPLAGVSPGVTSQTNFQTSYDAAVSALTAGAPNLKGVLVGVGNVANIPILFPVAAMQGSAAFTAGFDQAAGRVATSTDPFKAAPLQFDPNCTGAGATLVSFLLASQIASFRNDTNPTGQAPKPATSRRGHPAYIACGVSSTPGAPGTPVGEVFILTTTEQTALAAAVTNYNTYISGKATTLGWAYMSPNVLLDSLRTAGAIPTAPNLASATATFGSWFSLDGVHPNTQAHRALTNHMINAINAKYSTTLQTITVP
jgi:lysophospholipase L1-like esterase